MKVLIQDGNAYFPTPFGWIKCIAIKTSSFPGNYYLGYMIVSKHGGNMNKGFWKLINKENIITSL